MSLTDRIRNGWNAFMGREPPLEPHGYSTSFRPDSAPLSRGLDRTIVSSVYNRIAMDVAAVDLRHAYVDGNGNFKRLNDKSGLCDILRREANIDQTGREFIQSTVLSMFDEGVVAIVPVDTDIDPHSGSFEIRSVRAGKITAWYPKSVAIEAYNENTGQKQQIRMLKRNVSIVTNPFYAIMNHPNSTLQRLIRKMTILDSIDEQSGSSKLNIIVQLPYTIRNDQKRAEAAKRAQDLEDQLSKSKYGVAYTDNSAHIMQLNRPIDNNLLGQIEYLYKLFLSQLGINESILDGTADEKTMLNYNNRVIAPILTAISEEMDRKFLSKTAYTQNQRIKFMRDPFKLVPVSQIADIADKFTRSEILSSNELRSIVGFKPVDDPKANELRNSNLNRSAQDGAPAMAVDDDSAQAPSAATEQNGPSDPMSLPISALDEIFGNQNN